MNQQHNAAKSHTLRSGLIIYPSQDKAIDQALTSLAQKVSAGFILLTDITGQVISVKGQHNQIDLVSLGSLVAGDLAASQEIARLTNQFQEHQMILREGRQTHTFIIEAGHSLALLVQISTETPLGWGRMIIKSAAQQLAEISATPPKEAEKQQQNNRIADMLNQEKLPD